jgi:predicted esterase
MIEYLNKKIAEYLKTLDDTHDMEWYTTVHNFASVELENFMKWLENNE